MRPAITDTALAWRLRDSWRARTVRAYLDSRDWWVGYYRGDEHHYACPLPCVVIRWDRGVSASFRREAARFINRNDSLLRRLKDHDAGLPAGPLCAEWGTTWDWPDDSCYHDSCWAIATGRPR